MIDEASLPVDKYKKIIEKWRLRKTQLHKRWKIITIFVVLRKKRMDLSFFFYHSYHVHQTCHHCNHPCWDKQDANNLGSIYTEKLQKIEQ